MASFLYMLLSAGGNLGKASLVLILFTILACGGTREGGTLFFLSAGIVALCLLACKNATGTKTQWHGVCASQVGPVDSLLHTKPSLYPRAVTQVNISAPMLTPALC